MYRKNRYKLWTIWQQIIILHAKLAINKICGVLWNHIILCRWSPALLPLSYRTSVIHQMFRRPPSPISFLSLHAQINWFKKIKLFKITTHQKYGGQSIIKNQFRIFAVQLNTYSIFDEHLPVTTDSARSQKKYSRIQVLN